MKARWATVTQVSPLRIRMDGEAAALTITPDNLVKPAELAVGVRVWTMLSGGRLIVVGRAY